MKPGRWLRPSPTVIAAASFAAAALFLPLRVGERGNVALQVAAGMLAVYALAALVVRGVDIGARLLRLVRQGTRGRAADPLRLPTLTLAGSLALNVAFAAFKSALALAQHSPWVGTMAFYYIMLSVERLLLLGALTGDPARLRRDWRPYGRCGWLLLSVGVALAGMGTLAVLAGESASYPGYMIYAMAAYAFFAVAMAIRSLVRYRRLNIPALSACKAVSLATALASIYALQTALLSTFGDNAAFAATMNAASGAAVVAAVTGIAVAMIVRARRASAA